jgi:hypothetical protein
MPIWTLSTTIKKLETFLDMEFCHIWCSGVNIIFIDPSTTCKGGQEKDDYI